MTIPAVDSRDALSGDEKGRSANLQVLFQQLLDTLIVCQ